MRVRPAVVSAVLFLIATGVSRADEKPQMSTRLNLNSLEFADSFQIFE